MTRALSYLLLTAVTWYLAGMYRSFPLTALFVAELILFVLLAVQCGILCFTVRAEFPVSRTAGEKGAECRCRVRLIQRGRLPASRVRLTLSLSYPGRQGRVVRRLSAGGEPRSETELEFYAEPVLCGPVTVELAALRVYDLLALFPIQRRCRESMILAVFPVPRALRIEYAGAGGAWQGGDAVLPLRTGSSVEFRGLREYQAGDAARAIHWKQSARTDRLWTREYEQEARSRASLALCGPQTPLRAEQWDAFYEVLSALVLGLLVHAAAVQVLWRDSQGTGQAELSQGADLRDLLARLYAYGLEEAVLAGEFSLNTDLEWRRGGELVYRFSQTAFPEEIRDRVFDLYG